MGFIIGCFILGFGLAFYLAIAIVLSQKRAVKQAHIMIDSGNPDKLKAKKILKTLAACQTNEGKRAYDKLSELIGR